MTHPATRHSPPVPQGEILIFANPIAGRGKGAEIAERLRKQAIEDGFSVRVLFQRPQDVPDSELSDRASAAIAIGGDGTLRAVAERILKANLMCPLLPVPLGTANLMGRYLGIRSDSSGLENRVAAALSRPHILQLDAARANGRLCLLVAGVGFDAQVIHELDRVRHGPISFRHYLLPAALSLHAFPASPIRVWLEGQEVFPEAPGLAFVGNLAEYGTGFPILPYARPDDGLLDLCVLPCSSRAQLIDLFLKAAAGEHVHSEGVVYRKGKHIRIESPVPVPLQIDGDPAGHTPVQIDLLPVRLPFIVP